MPYQFGEFVSTYRDPQSVKIAETLRNRYVENLRANDQVAMALDQMKAALPFENDMAKKAELQKKIEGKLQSFVDKGGAYEDYGNDIRLTASEFSKEYKPIQENYERYQGALQTLSKQLDSGDINASDYNMATKYIIRGYKGFEVDPTTGKAVEGSMFSAPTIYKDPKLMDKVKSRLDILHEETHGEKVTSSGLDANGVWKSTSANKVSTITPEKVMEVYNSVIQEPDVQMYLDQRADMQLAMVEDSGNSGAYLDARIQTNQAAIDQLNKQVTENKYSPAQKKIITSQIDALAKENETVKKAKTDPNLSQTVLKSMFRDDLLEPVKGYALAKSYRSVETERGYENNYALYLDAHRRRQDKLDALGESLFRQGDVTADKDITGSTTQEKQDFIKNADAQIANLERQLQDTSLSQAAKDEIQAGIVTAKRDRERAQNQIQDAASKAITMADLEKQDPKLIATFKQMMPGATAGQIYQQIQRTFDNSGDQDFIDFQTAFDQKNGKGALAQYLSAYGDVGVNAPTDWRGAEINAAYDRPATQYQRGTNNVAAVFDNKFGQAVNAKYAEIKESRLYGERIQTGNDDLDIETTKQVKEYFVGQPIKQNEVVKIDGKEMSGREVAELGQDYKINKVFWHAGTNTYELDLVGKDGSVKTATMDGRRLQGTGLSQAMNRPSVRLGAAVMAQNSHDASSAPRYLRDITFNGAPVQIKITSRGDSNPYISFEHPDGRPFLKDEKGQPLDRKYKLDDPEVKELLESDVVIKGI
jgi:hypothetical protein